MSDVFSLCKQGGILSGTSVGVQNFTSEHRSDSKLFRCIRQKGNSNTSGPKGKTRFLAGLERERAGELVVLWQKAQCNIPVSSWGWGEAGHVPSSPGALGPVAATSRGKRLTLTTSCCPTAKQQLSFALL